MAIEQLLKSMWEDYINITPQAEKILNLFKELGEETIVNDHIALRTFRHPKLGIDQLSRPFLKYGYKEKGEYFFKQKKLYAKHFEPSSFDLPKIFISELKIEELSAASQKTINYLIDQIDESKFGLENFCMSGCIWKNNYSDYTELAKESEYAAWMSAFGFRPNHFTISINHLSNLSSVQAVNDFLLTKGIALNSSGGLVKGSPEVFLEQSSTQSSEINHKFNDGFFKVPGCYYEFAKRHKLPNGDLYHGFVSQSADKIFESTNRVK